MRATTRARDESIVRNHLVTSLGYLRLADLTFEHVQGWVGDLEASGLRPATVRKAHQIFGQMLDQAVRARRLRWNPARGVELPKFSPPDQRQFLIPVEVELLAATIEPRYKALVLLAAYSGVRWGEATALRVEDFDFLRRSVTIQRTLTEVGGHLTTNPPKTARSIRRISLSPFLVEAIAAHLSQWPADRDRLVFTAPEGGPLRRSNFRRRFWKPAIEKVGFGTFNFHGLRHSHASMLIAEGENPKVIADRMGHASPNVTLAVYSHLFPGLDIAAADRLETTRAKALTDPTRTQGEVTVAT